MAACCDGLSGLAVGLFCGSFWISGQKTFPSEAARQAHTHRHTPVLRLKALHYLRQSSSTSNPAAISAGQSESSKNDQKQGKEHKVEKRSFST